MLNNSHFSGVAIEALCAPSSTHSTQTICICLEAFTELISSSWSQAKIAYNHSTCVEYVNVLHRTVLTRSNAQVHIKALKSLLLLQVNLMKSFINHGCQIRQNFIKKYDGSGPRKKYAHYFSSVDQRITNVDES